jgi:hypothetical protein
MLRKLKAAAFFHSPHSEEKKYTPLLSAPSAAKVEEADLPKSWFNSTLWREGKLEPSSGPASVGPWGGSDSKTGFTPYVSPGAPSGKKGQSKFTFFPQEIENSMKGFKLPRSFCQNPEPYPELLDNDGQKLKLRLPKKEVKIR